MVDGFLPYGRQSIDDDDIAAVAEVLRTDYLTTGPKVREFEEAFAAKVSARFAVSCSSGTAALHLAALSLGLGPGDAVVVPSITFLATANAVRYVGAEVVFADVDPDSGLMGVEELCAALTRAEVEGYSPRAVFPVHLAGQCGDMEEIASFAEERNLAIVEDAAHALGTTYESSDGETVLIGSCRHSSMSTFSFHPVKTIAMGEGGVVATNDDGLNQKIRRFRNHGLVREPGQFSQEDLAYDENGDTNPWYYEMLEVGFNYRVSDIHCALAVSQLGKLDLYVEKRRRLAHSYDKKLSTLAPLVRPLGQVPGCIPGWHLYIVLIDFQNAGISRSHLMRALRERGIGTQVHYIPVHMQPYYRKRYGDLVLPGADRYYEGALSLPLFYGMCEEDVDRVVSDLTEILS